MRLNEIKVILEGYKEVKQKFFASNPDEQQDIEKYIELFRDLVDRNQLQGSEKNIDYWGKQGYESFKEMVEYKSQQKSKTQVKRSKVKGESITLYEDDEWLVVIPLDKDASCFHGKNTDWCTAKPNHNYFEDYFYDDEITLIYFIRKKDLNKWAIAVDMENNTKEFFDKDDISITRKKFNNKTGLDAYKFIEMAKKKQHMMQPKRYEYKEFKQKIKDAINEIQKGKHNYEIEDALIKLKDSDLIIMYMSHIGESSKYKKEFQMMAIDINADVIMYINNPDKDVQMEAIKNNFHTLQYIDNPDKEVQLIAVQQDGGMISFIDNSDKDVQMAAVKQFEDSIKFIEKPYKEVQLAAVKEDIYTIEYIDNPHPDVIKYVKENR